MRDEHYTPFQGPPPAPTRPREAIVVFVLARIRASATDSMSGALRTGPKGFETLYRLNRELYKSQAFTTAAAARADLARHRDALEAAGWTPVTFQP